MSNPVSTSVPTTTVWEPARFLSVTFQPVARHSITRRWPTAVKTWVRTESAEVARVTVPRGEDAAETHSMTLIWPGQVPSARVYALVPETVRRLVRTAGSRAPEAEMASEPWLAADKTSAASAPESTLASRVTLRKVTSWGPHLI